VSAAQYAAILGEPKALTQDVTGIDSFLKLSKPVCVRQNAAQQAFIKNNYPNLQIQPVPGLTQAGLLPAIVSGSCIGGIGPDIELKYGESLTMQITAQPVLTFTHSRRAGRARHLRCQRL